MRPQTSTHGGQEPRPGDGGTPGHTRRRRAAPMTLLEITLTTVLSLIVVSAALSALVTMCSSAHLAAQHTAAMCLCQESLEALRAETDFTHLTSTYYPTETGLTLTHTESPSNVIITCTRQPTITDASTAGVPAHRVVVTVSWTYRSKTQQERIEGIIYEYD